MEIQASPEFKHALKTVGKRRLLIVSSCLKCGASKTVPFLDGGIEVWEPNHRCLSSSHGDLPMQGDEDHPGADSIEVITNAVDPSNGGIVQSILRARS